jgi:exopolysaccharide biosynthesis protein
MGAEVKWNSADKSMGIAMGQTKLKLTVDHKEAFVNDERVALSDPAYLSDGVKYVPLKFVAEKLNMRMAWNANSASASLTLGERTEEIPVVKQARNPNRDKPIKSEKRTFKVGRQTFSAQIVTVSLLNPGISLSVGLAQGEIGKVDDLNRIAKKNGASVAINGSFFDAYTELDYKVPYGNVISESEHKHKSLSDRRTMFTFDKNKLVKLISGTEYRERYREIEIEGGVQAGPRLVKDGVVALNVAEEGFRDPKILTGGGARSALGITRDHKLILLTLGGATIPQLAEIMKQAGAYQAMNLDGGASSGLYADGKYLTTPGRKISNAILVSYQK